MADIIQIRRDTAANWTSVDPILAQGEMGWETDTDKLKFGDGVLAWSALSYFAGSAGVGTVTSVAWTTAQGISASVADPTGAANITIAIGALTGVTSYNGLVVTANTGAITTGTWNATPVTVPYGGTGNTTFTAYSVVCAGTTATGAFQNVVGVGTSGQVLTSAGAGALPAWATPTTGTVTAVSITTNQGVSGSSSGGATPALTISLGALTGVTSFNGLVVTANTGAITTGSWAATVIPGQYGGTGVANTGFTITLAGNLATTGAFNTTFATGFTGTITLPTSASTLATLALAETFTNKVSYNGLVVTANTGVITTGTWNGTAVAANYGGTGQTVYAVGDLLYASTTTALSKLADVAVGSYLRSGGVNTAPLWSTLKLPNSATANQIVRATSTDTWGSDATHTFNGTEQDIAASSASRVGYLARNTNSGGNASFYFQNNRASDFTGAYGGLFTAGSTSALVTLGVTRADKTYLISDGASSLGLVLGTLTAQPLNFGTNNTNRCTISSSGLVTWSAAYHVLAAGTATASTAPLKFTSGTNLTTAEAGAMEYNGTNLFFTRAGTVRENVLVAIDNVAAPSTSVGVGIVNYYGSAATNFLGDPVRWLSVNVLGSTYKIPLYS